MTRQDEVANAAVSSPASAESRSSSAAPVAGATATNGGSSSTASKFCFAPNEKILCFHGPLMYEAKVLKCDMFHDHRGEGPHYYIHYKGWKQSWDEWVPETRVLKYTPENLKKQADLNESVSSKKSKAVEKKPVANSGGGAESSSLAATGSADAKSTKKRPRESVEKEDEYLRKQEIKVPIPDALKVLLVDDWENITKNEKLVKLPRSPTVNQILDQYKESAMKRIKSDSRQEDILMEVLNGVRLYFNKGVGNVLLYRFERPQYNDLRKKSPDVEMADVYGPEHLLRLFVQLPSLLAHTNMDPENVSTLRDQFVLMLRFLEERHSDYFVNAYESSPPAYAAMLQN
ncbi:MRG-domain-containing protein [Zopfochytrium polystomum]|nr:MRG-domain-containing protein [Zopfochytrium polystomum]